VLQFSTARLDGHSLSVDDYASFENGIEPKWNGFTNPYKHLIEGPSPLSFRIPRVKKEPHFAELGIILAVEKESRKVIGSAGFHDFPDQNGMIEVGFGIVPEMQNNGFGKELLFGMWDWMSRKPEMKILRYTVFPTNAPSMHIIKKIGFAEVGEQIDDEDGVELIFEQSKEDYLKNRG
jgi:ribosomal-protein-alanine N-acetyltransferase